MAREAMLHAEHVDEKRPSGQEQDGWQETDKPTTEHRDSTISSLFKMSFSWLERSSHRHMKGQERKGLHSCACLRGQYA
eukprot:1161599-Pelagomonas_calceolata.AAC.1